MLCNIKLVKLHCSSVIVPCIKPYYMVVRGVIFGRFPQVIRVIGSYTRMGGGGGVSRGVSNDRAYPVGIFVIGETSGHRYQTHED